MASPRKYFDGIELPSIEAYPESQQHSLQIQLQTTGAGSQPIPPLSPSELPPIGPFVGSQQPPPQSQLQATGAGSQPISSLSPDDSISQDLREYFNELYDFYSKKPASEIQQRIKRYYYAAGIASALATLMAMPLFYNLSIEKLPPHGEVKTQANIITMIVLSILFPFPILWKLAFTISGVKFVEFGRKRNLPKRTKLDKIKKPSTYCGLHDRTAFTIGTYLFSMSATLAEVYLAIVVYFDLLPNILFPKHPISNIFFGTIGVPIILCDLIVVAQKNQAFFELFLRRLLDAKAIKSLRVPLITSGNNTRTQIVHLCHFLQKAATHKNIVTSVEHENVRALETSMTISRPIHAMINPGNLPAEEHQYPDITAINFLYNFLAAIFSIAPAFVDYVFALGIMVLFSCGSLKPDSEDECLNLELYYHILPVLAGLSKYGQIFVQDVAGFNKTIEYFSNKDRGNAEDTSHWQTCKKILLFPFIFIATVPAVSGASLVDSNLSLDSALIKTMIALLFPALFVARFWPFSENLYTGRKEMQQQQLQPNPNTEKGQKKIMGAMRKQLILDLPLMDPRHVKMLYDESMKELSLARTTPRSTTLGGTAAFYRDPATPSDTSDDADGPQRETQGIPRGSSWL
jgi:hypothetical protein